MITGYKRILLIGFRGAGKSTLGALLAQNLNWQYVSTDLILEQRHQKKIAEMVKESGWKSFREAEHSIIQDIEDRYNVVIDCGGGVIEREDNMDLLKTDSLIIWVDAKLEDLRKRISKNLDERPHLTRSNLQLDIKENYQRRKPLYHKYAHMKVDSSENSPQELCQKILNRYRSKEEFSNGDE